MLKKTIKYSDFDGVERVEDFYFNLTKAEMTEMELSAQDGTGQTLTSQLEAISKSNNGKLIIAKFKEIIGSSYGERSSDGKRFMKSAEITANFEGTAAYSELFMELVTDAGAAAAFIQGLVPQDLAQETEDAGKALRSTGEQATANAEAEKTARQRSEEALQGFKKSDTPSLPTVPVDEKFPTVPLVKPLPKPLDQMSKEELIAHYEGRS